MAPRPLPFGGAPCASCRGKGALQMRHGRSEDAVSRPSAIMRGVGLGAAGLFLLSSRPVPVGAAVKSSSLAETVAASQQVNSRAWI